MQLLTKENLDSLNSKQDSFYVYKCAISKGDIIFKMVFKTGQKYDWTFPSIIDCKEQSPFQLLTALHLFFIRLRQNYGSVS